MLLSKRLRGTHCVLVCVLHKVACVVLFNPLTTSCEDSDQDSDHPHFTGGKTGLERLGQGLDPTVRECQS